MSNLEIHRPTVPTQREQTLYVLWDVKRSMYLNCRRGWEADINMAKVFIGVPSAGWTFNNPNIVAIEVVPQRPVR